MTDLFMELLSEYEEQGFSYEEASEKAYYEEVEVLKRQADIKRKEDRENELQFINDSNNLRATSSSSLRDKRYNQSYKRG